MTREEALRSYTNWAAYAAFEEQLKGSIEPGKLADFILLKDPAKLLEPETVFKNGISIYKKEDRQAFPVEPYAFPEDFYHSVSIPEVTLSDFDVKVPVEEGEVTVRAMEISVMDF